MSHPPHPALRMHRFVLHRARLFVWSGGSSSSSPWSSHAYIRGRLDHSPLTLFVDAPYSVYGRLYAVQCDRGWPHTCAAPCAMRRRGTRMHRHGTRADSAHTPCNAQPAFAAAAAHRAPFTVCAASTVEELGACGRPPLEAGLGALLYRLLLTHAALYRAGCANERRCVLCKRDAVWLAS